MKRYVLLVVIVCAIVALSGCGQAGVEAPGDNPFFSEWTTPFGVAPFDEIQEEHFLPAFERAFAEELERRWKPFLRRNPEPPTFENTLT